MLEPAVFNPNAISEQTITAYAAIRKAVAAIRPAFPAKSARAYREAMREAIATFGGGQIYRSPKSRDLTVPGGPRLHVIDAEEPAGAYLHIHGGGWVIGGADEQDALLERLVAASGHTVVSVDYRLSPETPFPGPLDDCEHAARWLADHAPAEFGTSRLTIGGESAGANMTLATLLRLRANPASVPFAAGNLLYGVYDLTMTPSQRASGASDLSTEMIEWFNTQYVPDPADRTNPEASPLYAELAGLPPLLLTVGTADSALDDTLFLHARLLAANVPVELQVLPGGDHGFDLFPLDIADQATNRIAEFLTTAGRAVTTG
ncbi:MAG TPA: alpha/beta hydrolase [Amycolatopsis sp.]|nr:alpha/beta hydrolase [Amycolatopsis sp.]